MQLGGNLRGHSHWRGKEKEGERKNETFATRVYRVQFYIDQGTQFATVGDRNTDRETDIFSGNCLHTGSRPRDTVGGRSQVTFSLQVTRAGAS